MSVRTAQEATAEARPLLKDTITQALRDWIIQGRLKPGEQVSDKEISLELNTSRTPVREALLQLQSEGLVEVLPQRGTYVFNPDIEEVCEICVARGLFEADALRLGMKFNPDKMIIELGKIVARAAIAIEKGDLDTAEAYDTRFHETLLELSNNRYLLESYSRIALKMRALRHRLPMSKARMEKAVQQHRHIVDLIAVGEVDEAVHSIISHIDNVQTLLVAKLSATSD